MEFFRSPVYTRKLRKEEGSVALIVLIVVSSKARCLLPLISGQQQSSSFTYSNMLHPLFEYGKIVIRSITNSLRLLCY